MSPDQKRLKLFAFYLAPQALLYALLFIIHIVLVGVGLTRFSMDQGEKLLRLTSLSLFFLGAAASYAVTMMRAIKGANTPRVAKQALKPARIALVFGHITTLINLIQIVLIHDTEHGGVMGILLVLFLASGVCAVGAITHLSHKVAATELGK